MKATAALAAAVATAATAARRRSLALVGIVLLQAVGAIFFIGDVVFDWLEDGATAHFAIEMLVVVCLFAGLLFAAVETRRTLDRLHRQDNALRVARGELAGIIDLQFAAWRLTPAERDVGLFALKGLDVAEIAAARGAAPGTVRAQLTHIYAKAGVSGRAQFAAFFVEDLLSDGTAPRHAAGEGAGSSPVLATPPQHS